MKDEKQILSLTGLFLQNTLKFMGIGINEAVEIYRNNVNAEIESLFKSIMQLLLEKTKPTKYTDKIFISKWEKVEKQNGGYTYLCLLRDVELQLKKAKKGSINKSYINVVKKEFEENWLEKYEKADTGLSVSTFKNLKRWDCYKKVKPRKIEMLIDKFIISFFENNSAYYNNYIKWIQNIENLFNYENYSFNYTDNEYNSIKKCIMSYHSDSFERKDFYAFLRELIEKLEAISERGYDDLKKHPIDNNMKDESIIYDKNKTYVHKNKLLDFSEETNEIWQEIEKIYQRFFSFPDGTIGLTKDEISNILFNASDISFDNYLFARERKSLTWKDCKNNKGFMTLMLYQIYKNLNEIGRNGNNFVAELVDNMVKYSQTELGMYISKTATIGRRVWVDEGCYIGECNIESEVIISQGVVLNAKSIYIPQNVIIEKNVKIEGSIFVKILSGQKNSN